MATGKQTANQPAVVPKVQVPRSFELYVDGAKWLLAIIAGLLAYGFSRFEAHPGDEVGLALFSSSALLLGIAAACALYYLLMSYTFLSRRESGKLATDIEVIEPKRRSDQAFHGMLWTFAGGLLLFLCFGVSQLLSFRQKDEALVIQLSGSMTVGQRGEKVWELKRMPDGSSRWQSLPQVPK